MNREEGMELVQRSIDGDLNEEETSRLQMYLTNYPECAAFLEKLTRLSEELTQLPHVAPRYSLVDAILPQLEQLTPEPAPRDVESLQSPAALEARSRRTAGRNTAYRRIGAVVAAGVVAAVLIVAQPFSLLPKSDQDKAVKFSEALPEAQPAGEGSASSMLRSQNEMMDQSGGAEASAGDGAVPTDSRIADKGMAPSSAPSDGDPASGDDAAAAPAAGASSSSGGGAQAQASPPSAVSKNVTGASSASSEASASNNNEASTPPLQGFAPSVSGAGDQAKAGASSPSVTDTPESTSEPRVTFSSSEPVDMSWASPDGSLTAQAEGGVMRIVQTDGGRILFESESRKGDISNVTWGQDGQELYYTWTDPDGKSTDLWWDAGHNVEQTR